MYLVIYNLNTSNSDKAVAIGPFKSLHTVAEGELRMLPVNPENEVITFNVSNGYMFEYNGNSFTDLEIVEHLTDGWNEYEMEIITPEQYQENVTVSD